MSLEKIFADIHEALGKELLDKINSGEATAAELAVARQFLKDNGVDLASKPDNNVGQLSEALENDLPDFTDTDNIVNFGN